MHDKKIKLCCTCHFNLILSKICIITELGKMALIHTSSSQGCYYTECVPLHKLFSVLTSIITFLNNLDKPLPPDYPIMLRYKRV